MSIKLSESQVMDIHLNSRLNGGRTTMHTLCKRHGLTINEAYTVLRMDLKEALKRASKGLRFISWEPMQRPLIFTDDEIQNTAHKRLFGEKGDNLLQFS